MTVIPTSQGCEVRDNVNQDPGKRQVHMRHSINVSSFPDPPPNLATSNLIPNLHTATPVLSLTKIQLRRYSPLLHWFPSSSFFFF